MQGTSEVIFRDVKNSRISNEYYDTSGVNAVFEEGTSTDNQFISCYISNARAGTNYATFRTSGVGTTATRLIGCHIVQGTGGVSLDAINSAETATTFFHKTGTTSALSNTPMRLGRRVPYGISKTAGAATMSTSVAIDLGTSSSWVPAVINVRVASAKADGSGGGYTNNTIFVRHVTGSVEVMGNVVSGTAANLTITPSVAGNAITLTCTHASVSGPSFGFMWDIDVSSTNSPIIS